MIRRFVTRRLHRAHQRWSEARIYAASLDQQSSDRYTAIVDIERQRRALDRWEWIYLHVWGRS